jgi:hypothetical protein
MEERVISPEQHRANLERLNELSNEMQPQDFHITLKPGKDVSHEEVVDDTVKLLDGLQAYINNGHSLEGLPKEIRETFGEIKVYRTADRMEGPI